MKQLAHISKVIFLNALRIILIGHGFHELLTNEHSIKYNQSDYLAIIFET